MEFQLKLNEVEDINIKHNRGTWLSNHNYKSQQ